MVISPPFLPELMPDDTEETWLARAMDPGLSIAKGTRAPRGSFPVSSDFRWHSGLHVVAPVDRNGHMPVCAIADGEVIRVRAPTARSFDRSHPLNHSGHVPDGTWNDNGCVILKHTTEIGARGASPVVFTYFSLYMHLMSIVPAVQVGQKIYRKDVIGEAGQIGGGTGSLHLEVCCDTANLQMLLTRAPEWLDVEGHPRPAGGGRTDVLFGEIFFYLPDTTPTRQFAPILHLRDDVASAHPLNTAQWIGIRHEKGDSFIRGMDLLGNAIGTPIHEPGFEYGLYGDATNRHKKSTRRDGDSSPSGWYELLRFGRNLGSDPLPFNAAHWRQIPTARGKVWVDLNSGGVKMFSEADFLPVNGWNCFGMEKGQTDCLCKNIQIKLLVMDRSNLKDDSRLSLDRLGIRLGEAEVRKKLRRTICNLPTEWDPETMEARHRFIFDGPDVKNETAMGKPLLDLEKPFAAHCQALAVPDLPAEYKAATWHFHPAEFIATMRKCLWFSVDELTQAIPRISYKYAVSPPAAMKVGVSYALAHERIDRYSLELNKAFRKFGLIDPRRISHFLGQIYIETDLVRTMVEVGQGHRNKNGLWPAPAMEYYTVFYGRGMMQLTWPSNYEGYLGFRSAISLPPALAYNDHSQRITESSEHYWANPKDGGLKRIWAPRYDPAIIASDAHNACDSAGWYWVSKQIGHDAVNINAVCDRGLDEASVGRVSVLVNGGGYGYFERQAYSMFVAQYLNDKPSRADEMTKLLDHGPHKVNVKINFEHQRK